MIEISEHLSYSKQCSGCEYFYYSGCPDPWYVKEHNKPSNHKCKNVKFNNMYFSLCQNAYKICIKAIPGAKPPVIEIDRFELMDL
jgi:hypothetical protein